MNNLSGSNFANIKLISRYTKRSSFGWYIPLKDIEDETSSKALHTCLEKTGLKLNTK